MNGGQLPTNQLHAYDINWSTFDHACISCTPTSNYYMCVCNFIPRPNKAGDWAWGRDYVCIYVWQSEYFFIYMYIWDGTIKYYSMSNSKEGLIKLKLIYAAVLYGLILMLYVLTNNRVSWSYTNTMWHQLHCCGFVFCALLAPDLFRWECLACKCSTITSGYNYIPGTCK